MFLPYIPYNWEQDPKALDRRHTALSRSWILDTQNVPTQSVSDKKKSDGLWPPFRLRPAFFESNVGPGFLSRVCPMAYVR